MALEQGYNCYVEYQDAKEYFDTRLDACAWHNADMEDRENALVTASQILDDQPYIGIAVSSDQCLAWPRCGASGFDPRLGYVVSYCACHIPKRLETAVYELAYHLLANENLLDKKTQIFEEISIGDITVKDTNKDTYRVSIIPMHVRKLIRPLLVCNSKTWWRAA